MSSAACVAVQRRIDWTDTDAAGIYHHSTVWRLVEAAEAVLHDRLGIRHETFGRTPRVRVSAAFRRPLAFWDLVDVTLTVAAVGRTAATYAFALHCRGELAAEGEIVTVLLDAADGTTVAWPDAWRALLLEAGPQAPERIDSGGAAGDRHPRGGGNGAQAGSETPR